MTIKPLRAYLHFGSADNPPMSTVQVAAVQSPHIPRRHVFWDRQWRRVYEPKNGQPYMNYKGVKVRVQFI